MKPFRLHRGLVVPLVRRDIDTDQIIPKQFLKRLERTGFGEFLFQDWRRRKDGTLDPQFPLNDPRYAGASVLVTGANFACGSSREHAAWALEDYGIRAVIAPSFSDIFRANAIANGVLPIVEPEALVDQLGARAAEIPEYTIEVDLEGCRLRDSHGLNASFAIDRASRDRLLNGLDDISIILGCETDIARYEALLR